MKLRKLRWLALGVALAGMGLGVYWAQPPRPTITSWDAPEMMKLRGEWQALEDSPPTLSKADYVGKLNAIDHLIERRLRNDDMAALAANHDGPLQGDYALRQFESNVAEVMIYRFLHTGDRQSLVNLLSRYCPTASREMLLEFRLVAHGQRALKDPFPILGEVYAVSAVPEVRANVVIVIRRALAGFGIHANNDNEFVERAMRWYQENKDRLALASGVLVGPGPFPLFEWKLPTRPEPDWVKTIPIQATQPSPEPPKEVTNSIGMRPVLIPPGEFVMGARDDEEGRQPSETPLHPVRITKPFWLGVHEVTQAQYEGLIGKFDCYSHRFADLRLKRKNVDTSNFPVDEMSGVWAVTFCNRLSEKEELPPNYRVSRSEISENSRNVEDLGGPGYRLPTEAEWEYACRAGTSTPFSFGNTIQPGQANVDTKLPDPSYTGFACAVGMYPPNAFGLHDMHGNVSELCSDSYSPVYYEDSVIDDPQGPLRQDADVAQYPSFTVARGGSWGDMLQARSASRFLQMPWRGQGGVGFRVARSSEAE